MARASAADPAVEAVETAVYKIPTDAPEGDGTFAWDSTTMVLVRVRASGCEGLGWTYGPAACAQLVTELLAPVVCGRPALDVGGSAVAMLKAVRNAGRPGVVGYAISAVDCALWDLKARLLGVALHRLLGAVRPAVDVYGSGGFTTYSRSQLEEQLTGWAVQERIPRVKIKIGQDGGTSTGRDRERMRQAREIIGAGTELFVDANGAYTAKQAVRVLESVAELGIVWFEEPVSSNDLEGLRTVRARHCRRRRRRGIWHGPALLLAAVPRRRRRLRAGGRLPLRRHHAMAAHRGAGGRPRTAGFRALRAAPERACGGRDGELPAPGVVSRSRAD